MWSLESFPFLGRRAKDGGPDVGVAAASPRAGAGAGAMRGAAAPAVKVALERKVYRPGDTVVATIEIANGVGGVAVRDGGGDAVLMEDLSVEVRGIEKLDPQWLVTPKAATAKQRRGERAILKSSAGVIATDVVIARGSSSSYVVRTTLPGVLPPTFRGTAVRYLYYMTAAIRWSRCVADADGLPAPVLSSSERVEVRTAVPIWTVPGSNGVTGDEWHYGESGIVPPYALEVEIQWKDARSGSAWAWAADGSERSGEERASTPKSDGGSTFTSPTKSVSLDRFERSYSMTSRATPLQLDPHLATPTSSRREGLSASASMAELSVHSARSKQGRGAESAGALKRACSADSLGEDAHGAGANGVESRARRGNRVEEESAPGSPRSPAAVNVRGKSYNIRMDDEVLVKFSPKNPGSTYAFGDTVAGTLQFFHDDRRRCLEVTAVLETREVLNPATVHPSRKHSATISKVHSEYYEIVNDVTNAQFLFSIPADGPASMRTALVSVEWVLRFEFVATPAGAEWKRAEHPLLIDVGQRRKGEWSLPITVLSSRAVAAAPQAAAEARPARNSWARSPSAIYRSLFEEFPAEEGASA